MVGRPSSYLPRATQSMPELMDPSRVTVSGPVTISIACIGHRAESRPFFPSNGLMYGAWRHEIKGSRVVAGIMIIETS